MFEDNEQQPITPADGGKTAASGQDEGDKGKNKEPETLTVTRAEFERWQRERDEARESERYWAERARATGRVAEPEVVEEDDDEEDPDPKNETLVDDFSSKGVKALVDRGLLTKKAAKELIAKEAGKIAREIVGQSRKAERMDSAITTEFPELQDGNSALFKATSAELKSMMAKLGPHVSKSPEHLYLAASTARLKLEAAELKAQKTSKRRDDEDGGDRYDYDEEADRALRARSQGGGGRVQRGAPIEEEIGPQARFVMDQMFGDAAPEERMKIFREGQKRSGRR